MAKSSSSLCCLFVVMCLGGCGIGGSGCRVGQELGPAESCQVPGAGTFSVREDGCAGEVPVVRVDAESSSVSVNFSGGSVSFVNGKMCTKGYGGKQ